MFAKKEHELIASVIRVLPRPLTREKIAKQFASRLKFDNKRFNEEKFLKDCIIPKK